MQRSNWWLYAGLFLFALTVRLIYLAEISASDVFWILVGDGFVYETWALEINQNWVGNEIFYQAPLYPYFLATVYLLVGDDTLTVRMIQLLLGACSCVLLARAGRSFFQGSVGMLAGFLLAIYAPSIYFEGLVQKTALDLFLITLLLFALGRTLEKDQRRWAALAGLALGGLILTRENALVLGPIVGLWLLLGLGSRTLRRRAILCGAFALGTVLVLLPVTLRNWHVGNQVFVTTSQFGPNFYIGNNSEADGTYKPLAWGRGSALLERLDATTLAEEALGRQLSPAEVSSYWTGKALESIRAHPTQWLRLLFKKWCLVWNAGEISDSEEPAPYLDESQLLRTLWLFFHFGVIAPLALVGAMATWDQRRRLWLLYLMILAIAASTALFFVFARYRFSMIPPLLLFSAAGMIKIFEAYRGRAWRRVAVYAGLLAVTAAGINWRLYRENNPRVMTYYNMAVSMEMQGLEDPALVYYAKALDAFPDLVPAHFNRGLLLAKRGHFSEAEFHFRQATLLKQDSVGAQYQLAKTLLALGRPEEAILHFETALKLSPELHQAGEGLQEARRQLQAGQERSKKK